MTLSIGTTLMEMEQWATEHHGIWLCYIDIKRLMQTHHWNDIRGHVWEAHATRMESADQQLSVFIRVLVLGYVVCLYHLLLQHYHQLKKKNTMSLFFESSMFTLEQKRM